MPPGGGIRVGAVVLIGHSCVSCCGGIHVDGRASGGAGGGGGGGVCGGPLHGSDDGRGDNGQV